MTVAETRGGDHTVGPADAPVTLVEYGDYQCPYCAAARPVLEELVERAAGKARLVFRHYPLDSVHPLAQRAAEAAEAAGAQGRFWEMHDRLFSHQERLQLDDILGDAQAIGLDVERFAEDLRDGVHAPAVQADVESAEHSGVQGTPTFFIGDERHTGPYDAATLARRLEAAREG